MKSNTKSLPKAKTKENDVQNVKSETSNTLDEASHLNDWGFKSSCCDLCGIMNSEIDGLLLQCGKCKNAYYCSYKCFKEALPSHQQFCLSDNVIDDRPRSEIGDISSIFSSTISSKEYIGSDTDRRVRKDKGKKSENSKKKDKKISKHDQGHHDKPDKSKTKAEGKIKKERKSKMINEDESIDVKNDNTSIDSSKDDGENEHKEEQSRRRPSGESIATEMTASSEDSCTDESHNSNQNNIEMQEVNNVVHAEVGTHRVGKNMNKKTYHYQYDDFGYSKSLPENFISEECTISSTDNVSDDVQLNETNEQKEKNLIHILPQDNNVQSACEQDSNTNGSEGLGPRVCQDDEEEYDEELDTRRKLGSMISGIIPDSTNVCGRKLKSNINRLDEDDIKMNETVKLRSAGTPSSKNIEWEKPEWALKQSLHKTIGHEFDNVEVNQIIQLRSIGNVESENYDINLRSYCSSEKELHNDDLIQRMGYRSEKYGYDNDEETDSRRIHVSTTCGTTSDSTNVSGRKLRSNINCLDGEDLKRNETVKLRSAGTINSKNIDWEKPEWALRISLRRTNTPDECDLHNDNINQTLQRRLRNIELNNDDDAALEKSERTSFTGHFGDQYGPLVYADDNEESFHLQSGRTTSNAKSNDDKPEWELKHPFKNGHHSDHTDDDDVKKNINVQLRSVGSVNSKKSIEWTKPEWALKPRKAGLHDLSSTVHGSTSTTTAMADSNFINNESIKSNSYREDNSNERRRSCYIKPIGEKLISTENNNSNKWEPEWVTRRSSEHSIRRDEKPNGVTRRSIRLSNQQNVNNQTNTTLDVDFHEDDSINSNIEYDLQPSTTKVTNDNCNNIDEDKMINTQEKRRQSRISIVKIQNNNSDHLQDMVLHRISLEKINSDHDTSLGQDLIENSQQQEFDRMASIRMIETKKKDISWEKPNWVKARRPSKIVQEINTVTE